MFRCIQQATCNLRMWTMSILRCHHSVNVQFGHVRLDAVTLDVLHGRTKLQALSLSWLTKTAVSTERRSCKLGLQCCSCCLQMQWQDDLAVVKGGKIEQVLSGVGSLGLLPQMHSVYPLCVLNSQPTTLLVSGTNIAKRGCRVLCRHQGMSSTVTAASCANCFPT